MASLTMEWTPAIAVGVEIIDTQHKELFKLVNNLLAAFSSGSSKDEVAKALGFLQDYTINHFGMEEKYMTQLNYPSLGLHKEQHAAFIKDFLGMKARFETEGASTRLAMEIQKRLGDWLISHIKRSDKELADFLKGKV